MFVLRSNWFTTKDAIYWVYRFPFPICCVFSFYPKITPKSFYAFRSDCYQKAYGSRSTLLPLTAYGRTELFLGHTNGRRAA